MLELKTLTVKAGEKEILKNISYTFQEGKVYIVMGPNGSGKSTLAHTIMGSPAYEIVEGNIVLQGEDITELEAHERAKKGIFLGFQTPLPLSGVKPYELLRMALEGQVPALEVRKKAQAIAEELQINKELLSRGLNEGASGGERKKLEVLQAAVLDKPLQMFDEIDTGVDVDGLRTIGSFLERHKTGKTYIIITHYNRILEYITPDVVLVLKDGSIIQEGGKELVKEIEKTGYHSLSNL